MESELHVLDKRHKDVILCDLTLLFYEKLKIDQHLIIKAPADDDYIEKGHNRLI